MKITVAYHVAYDIEVDETTFHNILRSEDSHLDKGDKINALAADSDNRIAEMLKNCDGAVIGWCANPYEYDSDTGVITFANEDDDEMYWED